MPLPFNDAIAAGHTPAVDPGLMEEYGWLPSNPKMHLNCYQGAWVQRMWVPGIIAIQRGGDIVLATLVDKPSLLGHPKFTIVPVRIETGTKDDF